MSTVLTFEQATLENEAAFDSSAISEQPFGEDATVEVHYYLDLGGVVIEGIGIKGQGYVDAWAFSENQLAKWKGWIETERQQAEERAEEYALERAAEMAADSREAW